MLKSLESSNGVNSATDIRWNIVSDQFETDLYSVEQDIPQDGNSNQIEYKYSSTPLRQQELSNIQIQFFYTDENGFEFLSGRNLVQSQGNDGQFKLEAGKGGAYFES